jgi:hypothetical protein
MSKNNELKVITPKFRAAFVRVHKPEAFEEGKEPEFSLTMLFPQDTDLSELRRAAKLAKHNKWGNKPPKKLKDPFKDGNDYDYDGFEDMIVVRTATKYPPDVVDRNPSIHLDENDFYSGCWARASIQAFAFDKTVNKGVSFALRNVQKLEDDDSFVGSSKAIDDFNDDLSERSDSRDEFDDGFDDDDMSF